MACYNECSTFHSNKGQTKMYIIKQVFTFQKLYIYMEWQKTDRIVQEIQEIQPSGNSTPCSEHSLLQ